MGGRAFRSLHCPRISPDLYWKTRAKITTILEKLFHHVTVPTEMPEKADFGDIDFLVSGFTLKPFDSSLDWPAMVSATKDALNTAHGRRGFHDPSIMYFAIPAGDREGGDNRNRLWIQIDVKVCDIPGQQNFEWSRFSLNYASGIKILASLMKPLGFTINPDGIHIRVEEMENTNSPGSMILVSKEPKDVLAILELDWRFLWGGCTSKKDLYEYFASAWCFHPRHFQQRLEDEKYSEHHKDRSAPWLHFILEWLPQRFPNYSISDNDVPLEKWYKETRNAIRIKTFTLFPDITAEYYRKRKMHLKEVEENRLRELLMKAIPEVDENHTVDFTAPGIKIQPSTPTTPDDVAGETLNSRPPAPPPTPPPSKVTASTPPVLELHERIDLAPFDSIHLPREPPVSFHFRPPHSSMSRPAQLVCLARWTHFCETTGLPYLASELREKDLEMWWSDNIVGDDVLVEWVEKAWVAVWWRQCWVNYAGMWRKRFKKEDDAALKKTSA